MTVLVIGDGREGCSQAIGTYASGMCPSQDDPAVGALSTASALTRELPVYWDFAASWTPTDDVRREAAARAVALFDVVLPVVEVLVHDSAKSPPPVTASVAALRAIADGYALLAFDWPAEERERVPFPQRERVELVLRATGAFEWLESGGELAGSFSESNQLSEYTSPSPPDEGWLSRFVTDAARMIDYYPRFLDEVSSDEGRASLVTRRTTLWPWACRSLSVAKQWFHWAAHTGDHAIAHVGGAMLLIAEGTWLIASAETVGALAERSLPSGEFVAETLRLGGGAEWLNEQAVGSSDI